MDFTAIRNKLTAAVEKFAAGAGNDAVAALADVGHETVAFLESVDKGMAAVVDAIGALGARVAKMTPASPTLAVAPPAPPPAPQVAVYKAPQVAPTPATPVPNPNLASARHVDLVAGKVVPRPEAPMPGTGTHTGCTPDNPCPLHGGPARVATPDAVIPPR